MSESGGASPGMAADPPYPSHLKDPSLSDFNALSLEVQKCLDEALGELEYAPWPADARDLLGDGSVLAVNRCGLWIVYERDDQARRLAVWRVTV